MKQHKRITRKAAKAAGLRHYFTGKPCKHGHTAKRFVVGGCVDCGRTQSREWGRQHPEREQARYQRDRETILTRQKARYHANPAPVRAYHKEWCKRNRERIKAYSCNQRGVTGTITAEHLQTIFTIQRGACVYCQADLSGGYEVDHIQPLCLRGSNHPANIQLLCVPCHRRKNHKHPVAFAVAEDKVSEFTTAEAMKYRWIIKDLCGL